jgi:aminoglycoside/choline kinase family phosphotransferase
MKFSVRLSRLDLKGGALFGFCGGESLEFVESARKFYAEIFGESPDVVESVDAHASKRRLVRLSRCGTSVIVAYNPAPEEDKAFVALTSQFRSKSLPVPLIYGSDYSRGLVMMDDLGNTTLYDIVIQEGAGSARVKRLYARALEVLLEFQITAGRTLDYSACYPHAVFDHNGMKSDVQRFEEEFCRRVGIVLSNEARAEFGELFDWMSLAPSEFFMYRDFQSRNIMVDSEDRLWFIDYQNGCRGPLQYDVVSLLFQSRTALDSLTRVALLKGYLKDLEGKFGIAPEEFVRYYPAALLLRLFQVLGRYGKLGLGEGNPTFLFIIPQTIESLKVVFEEYHELSARLPALRSASSFIYEQSNAIKKLIDER